MKIRAAVLPNPLTIIEKPERIYKTADGSVKTNLSRRQIGLLSIVGKFFRLIYTTFYYYFFPLLVGIIQFYVILKS